MAFLGALGSILLGIVIIAGLMKSGETNGCFGVFLIMILVVCLFGALAIGILSSLGGLL